ncbi:uncharacterized protein LOC143886565 isoform X1 [Tasmannia lanceolata]|uniref:uncharacterized protein LOC143886565 isoform X1 n=1 Tax=Tasmannia lanceolata TaxID=3420 RepID=UPI0040648197
MDLEDDDHYKILGLPAGEEGTKLTLKEIEKAYRTKARICHPDKNPNDPHAKSTFQKLQSSYEILKNETARKAFDDLIRAKLDRIRRETLFDTKRRKMMSDLERREFEADKEDKDREEEELAAKKFREEVERIRAMRAKKMEETVRGRVVSESVRNGLDLDKEKILKVSWEKDGEGYSAERLKELFGRFGGVEDVVIRKRLKNRQNALVVMVSKDAAAAAVAATQILFGDLSNPLLVVPFHSTAADLSSASAGKHEEPNPPNLSNLVGAGYQAYEDSVLKKLQKAAAKQK